ncbi:ArsR/SmtB family transcription factor [Cohnella sp.]|uniref:ArsR/SmtB family transcription factor n=1 Tax=Cohnella sp. TaxID=1883426 RepID=UPI003567AD5F
MNIRVNSQHMKFLECFSSETRVKIIELLNYKSMNIKELAEALKLTSAMITKHVQKLEESGIIVTESITGKRGIQKVCSLALDSVTLDFKYEEQQLPNRYTFSIPVGQYTSHQVKPTCGLVSDSGIIGMMDDPRYFSDPDHVQARHLWFGSGYVEYRIPNYLLSNQKPESLDISLEICSEAPGYNEIWPSDISFHVRNIQVGTWTCPGDFGAVKGVFTPEWHMHSQYGLLKTLSIRKDGTYIDGIRLSDTRLEDLAIHYGEDILFRISVFETARNCGGVTLFGKGFGNYDQDIQVNLTYSFP